MLFLLTVLLVLPEGPAPAEIQGRWRVTEEVVEGMATPEVSFRDLRVEIEATTFRLIDGDRVLESRLAVDSQLRTLVITPQRGPRADRPFPGLYARTGERLVICLRREPSPMFPETMQMTGAAGTKQVLLTLTRER